MSHASPMHPACLVTPSKHAATSSRSPFQRYASDSALDHTHLVHDAMQSWSAHIETVMEETPLISLRTSHTREREHTHTLLLLYSAIFLLALAASLDSMSFNLYLNYACSEFQALSSVGTVMIAQQLVRAISKPPLARLADAVGRISTLVSCIAMYAGGYAVMASASSLRAFILGTLIQSLGATGVGVLHAIIMADTSSAQWRGFLIGLVNLPYVLNFALVGPLVDTTLRTGGWRLGLAMWVVVVPIAALPLLSLLVIGSRRASRRVPRRWLPQRAASRVVREMDLLGMLLLSCGLTLLLLPVSLEGPRAIFDAAHAHRVDVPTGVAFLVAFGVWETWTTSPLFPRSMLTNVCVSATCLIAALDFAGFYLSWTYLSPFVQILKNWDQGLTAYFVTTQNVTSTIAGMVVGSCMAYTRRLKRYLLFGFIIRLLGVLLMVHYRSVGHSALALLTCQVLQGIGGGALALTTQVAVQVAVEPSKIAAVIAFELLTIDLGAALGSTLASAVVQSVLPPALASRLPELSAPELEHIQGSLEAVLSHPPGTPMRTEITAAWVHVMKWLCVLSVVTQLPALGLSFFIPDMNLHEPKPIPPASPAPMVPAAPASSVPVRIAGAGAMDAALPASCATSAPPAPSCLQESTIPIRSSLPPWHAANDENAPGAMPRS